MRGTRRVVELDNIDIKFDLGDFSVNVLYLRFAPPNRIRYIGNHCHSGYELHFIPYGRGHLVSEGKSFEIEPNTFYLTGPGVYHEQIGDDKDPMAEYCLNFELTRSRTVVSGRKGEYDDADARRIGRMIQTLSFTIGRDGRDSIELFNKILDEINARSLGYYSVIRNHLFSVIVNVARRCGGDPRSVEDPPVKHARDRRRLVADLYVQDEWSTRSIDDCARRLGVSVRHVDRIFKNYYGMSFGEKLLSVRMDNARKLLAESDFPVKRVAELAGYEDSAYFCRVFKRCFKVTPSAYRIGKKMP